MKKITLLALTIIMAISCSTEQENEAIIDPIEEIKTGKIGSSINVNGVSRDFIAYVPQDYDASQKYPLVFSFHGLTSTMDKNYDYTDFDILAEQEGFIVIHPQGISNSWNAVSTTSNVDIDFTKALISTFTTEYSIDKTKIYATGMSNGGFLSFLLACKMSDTFAAIASVTGLMFSNVIDNCVPSRAVPILQIHGDQDEAVDYANVKTILEFWVDKNGTNTYPELSIIPDINTQDNSTVERYIYNDGINGSIVQHLKIIGGKHDWPGAWGNMDIDASTEIWNFFKQYDINGKI